MSKDLPSRIGRYEIAKLLGYGRLGPVYLALDPNVDREVAVKVLAIDDVDLAGQATSAARAAAALSHPNILTVYEIGTHDGRPFIAMEYVDGETLGDVIAQGSLSMGRRLELIHCLCEALAHAHDRGMLHTNILPGEIFVTREGMVKVPLLGVARLRLGTSGSLFRTRHYVVPEQIKGHAIDERSAVFSIGLILYEILTRTRVYSGDDNAVVRDILTSTPTPASALNADIGPALQAVIDTALQKEPSQRYQTIREFGKALARVASELEPHGTSATMIIPSPARAAAPMQERHRQAPAAAQPPSAAQPPAAVAAPRRIDENVQFSVYRPPAIEPAKWYSMLVFTHLSSRRPDAAPDEPDPLEEVGRRARALMGNRATAPPSRVDASAAIPEEGQLRVVPHVPGIEFNPPAHTFLWVQSIHQVDFSLRADVAMEGRTARGAVDVFLGALAVAHIPLAIPVEAQVDSRERRVGQTANPYRKLFASYSHKDEVIVRQFENYAKGLGDRYLRDVLDLRAGEVWNSRLCELIEAADVFQLFWSRNAMESMFVRQEWEYALTVAKPDFMRPVYWELPFPKREGLPPIDLSRLHFAFVGASAPPAAEPEREGTGEDTLIMAREKAADAESVLTPPSSPAPAAAARPAPARPAPASAPVAPPPSAPASASTRLWFIVGAVAVLIAMFLGWC
jgi:serine/threonine protein kinase